jgi:hypothetical protein
MKPEFFEENGSDFLITDPIVPNTQQTQQMHSSLPDYHTMEEMPTAQQRVQINNKIDTNLIKQDTVEEKLRLDAEALQQKFNPIQKSPIDKLKQLIDKGSLTKDIDAFGLTFSLRALDQSDIICALDEADSMATLSGRLPAIKLCIVTYSIESLDNVSVYDWFPNIKLLDHANNKFSYANAVRRALRRYLEPMPDSVINTLYKEYEIIEAERDRALSEIKNS